MSISIPFPPIPVASVCCDPAPLRLHHLSRLSPPPRLQLHPRCHRLSSSGPLLGGWRARLSDSAEPQYAGSGRGLRLRRTSPGGPLSFPYIYRSVWFYFFDMAPFMLTPSHPKLVSTLAFWKKIVSIFLSSNRFTTKIHDVINLMMLVWYHKYY